MAEKAKAEGNNFVKKLLSSNLTWSIVAFILLVIICTIFQHDFLALSWNSNTGGLAGPLITMLQESARDLMIATGMTLVISTAGIDLSVGSLLAFSGVSCYAAWILPPVIVSALPWLLLGYPIDPGAMLLCALLSMIGASTGEVLRKRRA